MSKDFSGAHLNAEKALAELLELRLFTGPPKEFWPRFLSAAQVLSGCDKLVVLARKPDEPWRRMLEWPAQSAPSSMFTAFAHQSEVLAGQAVVNGGVAMPLEARSANFSIATKLVLPQQGECVLAGLVSETTEAGARDALIRLRLAVQTPEAYQNNFATRQAKADVEKLASVLDLTVSVSAEKRFLATAMAFCNGVATRFNCDRVSLGWLERGYVRLIAISRTEKFDRQMAAAQALEKAMEESLDQDEEVTCPAAADTGVINRDHERFVREHNVGNVCSLPMRSNNSPLAVVTCERQSAPFTETELQQLRLSADLAMARLADLKQQDQWIGARLASQFREKSAKLLGPEHTWAKLIAISVALLLAALFVVRIQYRVEGNFVLRSDQTAYLSAPFDGYIDQVFARPGDVMKGGATLLKLKTSELELDESFALADVNRYQREAEKARAAKSLAEMRISEAMADQAKARLDLVRYRIDQASLKAPFAGVVVEGDLRERLGSPVKSADALFKLARIDTLYVEAEINERDVHEILTASDGEVAFVSQPKHKFPVHITAVEQAAMPKNDANVFLVRCALDQKAELWWRPGMSGVCKLNAGKRSLFWIFTHRTVDFLRLKLWW